THFLFCLTFLAGLVLTFENILAGLPSFHLAGLTFLPLLLASIRGALRVVAVADLLSAYRSQVNSQSWIYITGGFFHAFPFPHQFFSSVVFASDSLARHSLRADLASGNARTYPNVGLSAIRHFLKLQSGISCNFFRRRAIPTAVSALCGKSLHTNA